MFFEFQLSGFPDSKISKIWPGPGQAGALGLASPRVGPPVGFVVCFVLVCSDAAKCGRVQT